MKKKGKRQILERLAGHSSRFYPEIDGVFICPTCLAHIPISASSTITKAHILPQAAGGRLQTFLCKDCNSRFGAKQDRWFGEYTRLIKDKKHPLEAGSQAGFFEIDGVRVGGEFRADRDKGFEFFIDTTRSSPKAVKRVVSQEAKGRWKVTIPMPILSRQRSIDVGFLTAGYLLWFKEFGYSWALQKHLDIVRLQISKPEEEIIKQQFTMTPRDEFYEKPWIGVIKRGEHYSIVAGIANKLVLFPSADMPNSPYNETNAPPKSGSEEVDFRTLSFYQQHKFEGPLGILFGNRLLVCPDVILKHQGRGHFLMFQNLDADPVPMYPTPAEEFQRMKDRGDVNLVKVPNQPEIPVAETGRATSTGRDR